jgi:hypothetical protein
MGLGGRDRARPSWRTVVTGYPPSCGRGAAGAPATTNQETDVSDESGTYEIQVGPVLVDVPRSIGYFGGVTAAVALGLVDPPLAAFIAAAPFLVMLTHRSLPTPVRFLGETLEGAAKPIGGDDDGYVKLQDDQRDQERARAIAAAARRGEATDPSHDAPSALRSVEAPSPVVE